MCLHSQQTTGGPKPARSPIHWQRQRTCIRAAPSIILKCSYWGNGHFEFRSSGVWSTRSQSNLGRILRFTRAFFDLQVKLRNRCRGGYCVNIPSSRMQHFLADYFPYNIYTGHGGRIASDVFLRAYRLIKSLNSPLRSLIKKSMTMKTRFPNAISTHPEVILFSFVSR